MSKYVTEILHELNTEPNSARLYKDNSAIKFVFEYAYDPAKKMVLPEGDPPFKEDAAPIGMSPANLMMELKKLYVALIAIIWSSNLIDQSNVTRHVSFGSRLAKMLRNLSKFVMAIT